jgi:hypothetical protein
MDLPSDLIDLLAEFDAAGVEYLLVGGQALAMHGHPRFTKDAGVWLRDTPDNLARAAQALGSFGAPPATIAALGSAAPLDVVWMGLPPSRIDLMKGVPGGDFERAWQHRSIVDCEGTPIMLVTRAELARLKRASGRPQDLLDAALLEADGGDGVE